ncbi:MAG: toxin-activating lysine-acyltransferase [Reinekea forsetii]|nr:toxin-activating lysine-acyltransferase [Reinekea forsetii]
MNHDIESPLAVCSEIDATRLTDSARLGVVTDLALHQDELSEISIPQLVNRVCAAARIHQTRFFFDFKNRPYAYVSWAHFNEQQHRQLLAHNSGELEQPERFFIPRDAPYLWFYDLICPFSSPLQIFKTLKESMPTFAMAHLLQRSELDEHKRIRRIW